MERGKNWRYLIKIKSSGTEIQKIPDLKKKKKKQHYSTNASFIKSDTVFQVKSCATFFLAYYHYPP